LGFKEKCEGRWSFSEDFVGERKWGEIASFHFTLDLARNLQLQTFYEIPGFFHDFRINHGKALMVLHGDLDLFGKGGFENIYYEMINCNAGVTSNCRAPAMLGSFH
jgi:hypothetical protein